MHNAGHWSAFITLHQGGTIVVQGNPRHLDPDDIWRTVERERIFTLSIVGDAFARPLVDQLRSPRYDLSALKVLGSGGAILSASLKQALLELLPDVVIIDGFGASETGAQGATATAAGAEAPTAFRMDEHTVVLDEAMSRRLRPGEAETGWVARSGHVPLGYLGDEAKTRQTYRVIDGVRYSVPGDRAQSRRTAASASSAATRRASTPAARRSSPRKSSARSSVTPPSTTSSSPARRANAGASR